MSFYKNDSGVVLCGPNFVLNREYTLESGLHDTYTYPIDGWYWFDNIVDVYNFFGIEYTPEDVIN